RRMSWEATMTRRSAPSGTTSCRSGCPRPPRHPSRQPVLRAGAPGRVSETSHRARSESPGPPRAQQEEVVMRRELVLSALALVAMAAVASRSAAYEAVAVTDGGTLSGSVKFDGAPPAPAKIQVTKDPEVCGKEKTNPELLVGAGGGIANVVVVVKAAKGKKLEVPAQNPLFDQKTCEFNPHILLFPAGSTIDVQNSDGILHNIHTTSQT